MPELPDLQYVAERLDARLRGHVVTAARIGDPTVLRIMVDRSLPEFLCGQTLKAIGRRGHFLRFDFGPDAVVVINAMLVGKYRIREPSEKRGNDPNALGFAWSFDDGVELLYLDDKRMGKVYVTQPGHENEIPVYANLGADLLAPDFTLEKFRAIVRGRRNQVRQLLMDKEPLASIGNAYADEILFAAGLHPKTFCNKLTATEVDALHAAIVRVLTNAIAHIRDSQPAVDEKVRDFLSVRGRHGKPCPVCRTTIRAVRTGDGDACFCPTCQPTERRLFIDWSKVSKSWTAGTNSYPTTKGLRVLNAGNLLKSRSTVSRVSTPLMRQQLAIRASCTLLPRMAPARKRSAQTGSMVTSSLRTRRLGDSRHAAI